MIVCDRHGFVFVHVQKTGGSSVTKLLMKQLPAEDRRSVAPRHSPLSRILREEPRLADYFIFGFVRDPWDRMVSWFNMIDFYRRRYEERGQPFEKNGNPFWVRCAKYQDFEEFILRGTEELPRLRRPQVGYLRTRQRKADFIGRTENLSEDTARAMAHLGLEAPPVGVFKKGQHERASYRGYYTPASRRRVEEVFAKDLTEFGYRF